MCLDEATGTSDYSYYDAGVMLSNVCPTQGSVLFRVRADESWVGAGDFSVPQDTVRWKYVLDSDCTSIFNDCVEIRTSVLQASGDRYNYRYFAWNTDF